MRQSAVWYGCGIVSVFVGAVFLLTGTGGFPGGNPAVIDRFEGPGNCTSLQSLIIEDTCRCGNSTCTVSRAVFEIVVETIDGDIITPTAVGVAGDFGKFGDGISQNGALDNHPVGTFFECYYTSNPTNWPPSSACSIRSDSNLVYDNFNGAIMLRNTWISLVVIGSVFAGVPIIGGIIFGIIYFGISKFDCFSDNSLNSFSVDSFLFGEKGNVTMHQEDKIQSYKMQSSSSNDDEMKSPSNEPHSNEPPSNEPHSNESPSNELPSYELPSYELPSYELPSYKPPSYNGPNSDN